jgi:hypothetical protein
MDQFAFIDNAGYMMAVAETPAQAADLMNEYRMSSCDEDDIDDLPCLSERDISRASGMTDRAIWTLTDAQNFAVREADRSGHLFQS